LAGCATTTDGAAPGQVASGETTMPMICNADRVQGYVGGQADQAAGAAILKDSGARSLRWGPPNAAWTMDYRQDRVNVQYGETMKIERITCG
ncbi:MAG: Peptidase inhibitor I78 family, partial [Porphyrobacter sp. HL-46]